MRKKENDTTLTPSPQNRIVRMENNPAWVSVSVRFSTRFSCADAPPFEYEYVGRGSHIDSGATKLLPWVGN